MDVTGEVKSGGGDATSGLTETAAKPQPFKDPNFVVSEDLSMCFCAHSPVFTDFLQINLDCWMNIILCTL